MRVLSWSGGCGCVVRGGGIRVVGRPVVVVGTKGCVLGAVGGWVVVGCGLWVVQNGLWALMRRSVEVFLLNKQEKSVWLSGLDRAGRGGQR